MTTATNSVFKSNPAIGENLKQKTVKVLDDIISCPQEVDKQLCRSLENIEDESEILRGIKLLTQGKSKGVKLERRVSKKRRLRLSKLKNVRRQCEQLQQEYRNKADLEAPTDNVTIKHFPSAVIDANEHEAGQVNVTDDSAPSTADEMNESDRGTGSKQAVVKTAQRQEKENELKSKYRSKVYDYLRQQLNVKFDLCDDGLRQKELADVLFYCLFSDDKLYHHEKTIICRLFAPLYDHTRNDYSWFEWCCKVLCNEKTFAQFYKRLGNKNSALEYIIYDRLAFLLIEGSGFLMERLIEYLPYHNLRSIITSVRSKKGQTCMFSIHVEVDYEPYVKLYNDHIDELYKLISVKDVRGQTAMHANFLWLTSLLADTYTPNQRDAFLELISMTDNNKSTVLDRLERSYGDFEILYFLTSRVINNEYILNTLFDCNILIIYNTNNRPGAEEEAQEICDVCCKSVLNGGNIKIEKDKNTDDLIELVREAANKTNIRGVPFKSLIVILTSHGHVGTIDDYDGHPIKIAEIEEAMCSKALNGRPKMLIAQCCQLGDESSRKPPYAPTHDHFCAVMSCLSGQPSERGVFLTKLCEQIENSRMDINIFKLVNQVAAEMERKKHPQTPLILSTLKAEFCPTDNWWDWPVDKLYDC